MSVPSRPQRYLLDQNFPVDVLRALRPALPPWMQLDHVPEVDLRLSDAEDRDLIIWANRAGYDALVSTNHRMKDEPAELAAMLSTKLTVVLTLSMGHSPLRAAGVVLLELPTLHDRVRPGKPNLFVLSYERRQPRNPWDELARVAAHRRTTAQDLWSEVRPSEEEMSRNLLAD